MKTSPTKSWWDSFKEAVGRLPDGPINHTPRGTPIPVGGTPPTVREIDVDQLLADNTRLLMENQRLRQTITDTVELRLQLANAKLSEAALARRIEVFRKTWPDIHKKFFSTERKTT